MQDNHGCPAPVPIKHDVPAEIAQKTPLKAILGIPKASMSKKIFEYPYFFSMPFVLINRKQK